MLVLAHAFADFEDESLVLIKKLISQYFVDTFLRHTWDTLYEAHFFHIQMGRPTVTIFGPNWVRKHKILGFKIGLEF